MFPILPEEVMYRYDEVTYSVLNEWGDHSNSRTELALSWYPVLKHTLKGVWVQDYSNESGKRFILLTARKKFACKTKLEALEQFKYRKYRHRSILLARIKIIDEALSICDRKIQKESK